MPKLSEMLHFSGAGKTDSVEYVAERIWREFHNLRSSNHPTEKYTTADGVIHSGYVVETAASVAWQAAFPGVRFESFAALPVSEALRKSGNVVCTANAGSNAPFYFVRDHWRKFSEMGPAQNPKAKVIETVTEKPASKRRELRPRETNMDVIELENGTYKCTRCPYTDHTFSSVQMHINRTGARPHAQGSFPCHFNCGQISNSADAKAAHLNKRHNDEMRSAGLSSCHECGLVDSRGNIMRHRNKEHGGAIGKPHDGKPTKKTREVTTPTEINTDDLAIAIAELVANQVSAAMAQLTTELERVKGERDSLARNNALMKQQFEDFQRGLSAFKIPE